MKKTDLVFALLLASCSSDMDRNKDIGLEGQEISEIESALRLPSGASALEAYDRYYYLSDETIEGRFTKAKVTPGKVLLVEANQLPQVLDGGCDVIFLHIDRGTKVVNSILCSGTA